MHVKVYNPVSGFVYLLREIADDVIMDARAFADQIAKDWLDSEIDDKDGYFPNCCGDIAVVFLEDPENAWHIWSGESFCLKKEDY